MGSGSRHNFLDAHCGNRGPEGRAVNAVSVPDQVPRPCVPGEGLPDLLCNPRGRRPCRDRIMHDPAPVMAQDDEAAQQPERCGRYNKEIHRRQAADMVFEEHAPKRSRPPSPAPRDRRPSAATRARLPGPEQAEAFAMPADHCCRLDDRRFSTASYWRTAKFSKYQAANARSSRCRRATRSRMSLFRMAG